MSHVGQPALQEPRVCDQLGRPRLACLACASCPRARSLTSPGLGRRQPAPGRRPRLVRTAPGSRPAGPRPRARSWRRRPEPPDRRPDVEAAPGRPPAASARPSATRAPPQGRRSPGRRTARQVVGPQGLRTARQPHRRDLLQRERPGRRGNRLAAERDTTPTSMLPPSPAGVSRARTDRSGLPVRAHRLPSGPTASMSVSWRYRSHASSTISTDIPAAAMTRRRAVGWMTVRPPDWTAIVTRAGRSLS